MHIASDGSIIIGIYPGFYLNPQNGVDPSGILFYRSTYEHNIYVKSKRAGSRVVASIGKFIEEELQLKVNQSKSAVDSPTKRKFLGSSFYYSKGGVKVKLHSKTLDRIKAKVKTYTKRSNGKSIEVRITDLDLLIQGWVNYFTPTSYSIINALVWLMLSEMLSEIKLKSHVIN